jgi:hypothetical protein
MCAEEFGSGGFTEGSIQRLRAEANVRQAIQPKDSDHRQKIAGPSERSNFAIEWHP